MRATTRQLLTCMHGLSSLTPYANEVVDYVLPHRYKAAVKSPQLYAKTLNNLATTLFRLS